MNLENEILSLFPAYDPGWPAEARKAWMADFAELIRIVAGGEMPAAAPKAEKKPRRTHGASIAGAKPDGQKSETCLNCGKEFIPNRKTQRFCSSECRYTHNNRKMAGMCPKCHKLIKPADLTIAIDGRKHHTDCVPGE